MANGIDPGEFNKGRSSMKFEKDEDNSPKTLNDKKSPGDLKIVVT